MCDGKCKCQDSINAGLEKVGDRVAFVKDSPDMAGAIEVNLDGLRFYAEKFNEVARGLDQSEFIAALSFAIACSIAGQDDIKEHVFGLIDCISSVVSRDGDNIVFPEGITIALCAKPGAEA